MSNPILSIITINRNNADGLRKTIESVLSQDVSDKTQIEYIIIDGASTDNSVDVIKSFENNQSNKLQITKWISEPDSGIYNAMNKGIKMATGELIGIMNSGDTYFPNALNKSISIFKEYPKHIQYGIVNKFMGNHFEGALCPRIEYLEESMIPHNATFVPKDYYEMYGYYNENFLVLADYDCFLRFYSNKLPFFYSNNIVCNFDLSGVSSTMASLVDRERIEIKQKYGYYIAPSKKQKIKNIIKKLFRI